LNASGLLWGDAAFASLVLYSAFFGWAATLVGWATCLFIGFAHRKWRAAGGCALLGFLPALYIVALFLLASAPDTGIAHLPASDILTLVVMGGMVVAILACPVAAGIMTLREFRARSRREPGDVR